MSEENIEHREKMCLFVQGRNSEVDRQIEETKRCLENTRKFLDRVEASQLATREMLEKMLSDLEFSMIRLRNTAHHQENAQPPVLPLADLH